MRTLLSASILLALSGSAYADTLVYAGTLIDGTQNKPQQQMTIVIDEGRIIGIEQGYKTATAGDLVIDRKDSTVMPGFIDMHTHLTSQLGPGSYMNKFTKSAADVTLD